MVEKLRSIFRYIIRKIAWESGEDTICWDHVDYIGRNKGGK